ncbi:homeobox-leucine zipper protein ATHB-22-like [Vicia villosa]|uniref:homeobox-leucine zipper protein ATHB-22-like n=1 Tax=Vicia villosa TaxID=3911 RepID=UPI00273C79FA|nr:homeobox-leucine zipper protein ATHB-22-like [Vicia villosa]
MDWNIERTVPFVPPPESSLSFLYNYNNYTYSGMEVSEAALGETQQRLLHVINNGNDCGEKKKTKNKKIKLTSNQVESLEKNFQEEIKLDPERKMKLSAELGLHPRQIAVWFQNRRTRWKTKQLQHSNDVLKHSCDALKQENQKLKEEVMELKEKLKEKDDFRRQTFGEETVESPLEGLRWREIVGDDPYPCSNNQPGTESSIQQCAEGYDYSSFIVEDFDSVSLLHNWP